MVEEDKRNNEPKNIEGKRKRLEWEEQEAKKKKECKEKGNTNKYISYFVIVSQFVLFATDRYPVSFDSHA